MDANVANDELKRLRKKNATLEGQVSDLRVKNNALKRQNTVLQNKVKGYDKKVERVMERVVKELSVLIQNEEQDGGDATPQQPKRPRKQNPKDSLNINNNSGAGPSPATEEEMTPEKSKDASSAQPEPDRSLDTIINERQNLMNIMKQILDKST